MLGAAFGGKGKFQRTHGRPVPSSPAGLQSSQGRLGTVKSIFSAEFSGGSIAAINLPNIGRDWYLVKVTLVGGAGDGSFILLPTGTWKAHFIVTNGGFQSYDVEWKVGSTVVAAAQQTTFGTAPSRVCLTFSDAPWDNGTPIENFCAIAISDVEGGANASAKTLAAATYDVAPARPIGYLMLTTAGNAQLLPPVANGIQQTVEAQLDTITFVQAAVEAASDLDPQQTLTVSITNSAAATLHIWAFYNPDKVGLKV